MGQRPTVYEAGVSIATASRYFSGPERLSEATRGRVSEPVQALGYVQNVAAKRLAGGSTNTIALWLPGFHEPEGPMTLTRSDGAVPAVSGGD